jgi:hypothetical protein
MQESLDCMRRIGDRRLVNRATVALGQALVVVGDVEAAEPLARESLAVGRELGAARDIHYSLHFLADCALFREDGVDAAGWYVQSMSAALDYRNIAEAALELQGIGMALAVQGRHEEAVRLAGAAAARMEQLGFDISGAVFWNRLLERHLGVARSALGEARAAELDAEGRAMGWSAAVAAVLGQTAPEPTDR